ncbi:MAG: type II secretion system protein GspN [Candidatus Tectomicrobia bacterium]
MASRKRVIIQILAYTLYGLAVCLVLVYLTFPYDLLKQRLIDQFSQGDLQLKVARIGPDFPPGVALRNVRLVAEHLDLPGAVIQAQRFRAQPAWFLLLAGAIKTQFNATLYSGRLHGRVISPEAHEAAKWQIQGDFADLRLERHPLLQKAGEAFLRGQLEGDLALTLDAGGQMEQGTLNLRLQSAVLVGGKHPGLPLQRDLACDTLQSQIKMTAKQMQIVSFTCRGDDLSIQIRGTVNWRQPLQNSSLNLHLQLRSESAYKQELGLIATLVRRRPDRRGTLSFSIRGTMRQPKFGA